VSSVIGDKGRDWGFSKVIIVGGGLSGGEVIGGRRRGRELVIVSC
jgi:hypothetical protein